MIWEIYDIKKNKIGTLAEEEADDEKDAVLNWADENLTAFLKNN